MTYPMPFWVCNFILQAGLLCMVMYELICLSDLANDFINPHDCAKRINRLIYPEMALHAFQTALFLVTGHYWLFFFDLPVLVLHIRNLRKKEGMVDVTEAYKQLPNEKKQRYIKLGLYTFMFTALIYKLVEDAVAVAMGDHPYIHEKNAAIAKGAHIPRSRVRTPLNRRPPK